MKVWKKVLCGVSVLTIFGTVIPTYQQSVNGTMVYADSDNSTMDNATKVYLNKTYVDTIENFSDENWYKFSLDDDGIVSLDFARDVISNTNTSVYWNIKLYSYDNSLQEVASWRLNSDEELTTVNGVGLAKGDYYIKVSTVTLGLSVEEVSRDYQLTVNYSQAFNHEKELNDTTSNANPIELSTEYTGSLSTKEDVDYYSFTLDQDSDVTLNFNREVIGEQYGIYWNATIYDSDEQLSSVWELNGREENTSNTTNLKAGKYYLKVSAGLLNYSDEDYKFTITTTKQDTNDDTNKETEPNDTTITANAIDLDTPYTGSIGTIADLDYYSFNIDDTSDVTVTLKHSVLDSTSNYWKVSIYNSALSIVSEPVQTMEVSGDTESATLTAKGLSSGKYYVRVSSSDEHSTNDYTISVSAKTNSNPVDDKSGTCGEDLTWSLDDKGVLTISGTGNMEDYTLLSKAPWSDYSQDITSIVVKDGVTSIGDNAFINCNKVEQVSLSNDVETIGDYSFSGCTSLTDITLPNGLKTVPNGAFALCTGLKTVTVPKSVTEVGTLAFSSCTSLTDVYYDSTKEDWDDITIATGNDSLTSANIHYNGSSTDTVVDSGTCGEDLTWSLDDKGVLTISGTGNMEDYTLLSKAPWSDYSQDITSIVVKDGVTSIGDNAFINCNKVEQVSLSNDVETIGDYSFSGCTSLTDITLPNGLKAIPNGAFALCTGLKTVTVPKSVTEVGTLAFSSCTSLSDVYYDSTKEDWDNITIATGNDSLTSANIHYSTVDDIIKGDVNLDGKVSTADLLSLKKYLLGITELSDQQFTSADINEDGKVSTADLLSLKKYLLGVVDTL